MTTVKDISTTLGGHLFHGEMTEFDAVVEKYKKDNPSDPNLKEVFHALAQQFGLTSFRSLSTDRVYLRQERLLRECKLLETFTQIDQQLFLLRDPIEDLSQEHFPFLTPSPTHLHPKPKSLAHEVLSLHFYKKSFKTCEALEKIYHLSWFDKVDHFLFPYRVKNAHGLFQVDREELSLSPLFCLLTMAPTNDHLNYLKTKGVTSDHLSKILSFTETTRHFIMNDPPYFLRSEEKQSCLTTLDLAESLCLKETLNASMPQKSVSPSRKI